jgi:hypothetical protein
MKMKIRAFLVIGLLYAVLFATPIIAKTETVEGGMTFTTNTYYVPPVTKWGFVSLSGNAYSDKSVTACVGACTTSGWQTAYEVKADHAGFSWNTFYAYYNFRN